MGEQKETIEEASGGTPRGDNEKEEEQSKTSAVAKRRTPVVTSLDSVRSSPKLKNYRRLFVTTASCPMPTMTCMK
jgi:hypothetical protein